MRSALISLASFFIPFFLYGNHVGHFVAKHLIKASYSARDVELGYVGFFLFAGTLAGLSCLVLRKIFSSKKQQKYLALGAVLLPIAFGYFIADVTLYGFYERAQFTGPVMEWLSYTAMAFALCGLLPAAIFFMLVNARNQAIAHSQ